MCFKVLLKTHPWNNYTLNHQNAVNVMSIALINATLYSAGVTVALAQDAHLMIERLI